jgi:hypothetical protein
MLPAEAYLRLPPRFFLHRFAAEEQKSKCADQCYGKELELPAVVQFVQQHQRQRRNNQSDAGGDTSPVQIFHRPFIQSEAKQSTATVIAVP